MFDVDKINKEIQRNQREYEVLKNNVRQAERDTSRLGQKLKDLERDIVKAEAELKKVTDKRDAQQKEKDRIDQLLDGYKAKMSDYERNILALKTDLEKNINEIQAGIKKK